MTFDLIIISLVSFGFGFLVAQSIFWNKKKKRILCEVDVSVSEMMNSGKNRNEWEDYTTGVANFQIFKREFLCREWKLLRETKKDFKWMKDVPSLIEINEKEGTKKAQLHAHIIEFDNRRMILEKEDLEKAYLLVKEHWDNRNNPWFESVIISDKNLKVLV